MALTVVYHLIPTSNHNGGGNECRRFAVVYHLIPTSNHNLRVDSIKRILLYII